MMKIREEGGGVKVGDRFGRLVVVGCQFRVRGRDPKNIHYQVVVECDCGEKNVLPIQKLAGGETTSCGCYQRESMGNRARTHGDTGSKLYWVWRMMRTRCYDTNYKNYDRYGGRGIRICDEWLDNYEEFRRWSKANGYREGLTIERKDNDGPYSPGNCEWATRKKQANNRRSSRMLTHQGKTQTLAQWADETGIKCSTISQRIDRLGWSTEDALMTQTGEARNA